MSPFIRNFEEGLAGRGIGARRSSLCQRFRPLFCHLFPMPPPWENGDSLGPVSRQPPPANPFSKPLTLRCPPEGPPEFSGHCKQPQTRDRAVLTEMTAAMETEMTRTTGIWCVNTATALPKHRCGEKGNIHCFWGLGKKAMSIANGGS